MSAADCLHDYGALDTERAGKMPTTDVQHAHMGAYNGYVTHNDHTKGHHMRDYGATHTEHARKVTTLEVEHAHMGVPYY